MKMPTNYGDPWKRFAAYLIDGLILGAVVSVLWMVLVIPLIATTAIKASSGDQMSESEAMTFAGGMFGMIVLVMLLSLVLYFCYFVLQHSSAKQATLGKRAMKLYVTDEYGNRLTFGKAAIRFIGRIINSFTMGIGYIIIFFTDKKQGLHDIIGKTLVLDGDRMDHQDEFDEIENEEFA